MRILYIIFDVIKYGFCNFNLHLLKQHIYKSNTVKYIFKI